MTAAIMAAARLDGNAAALDVFLECRDDYGLSILDMDLQLPRVTKSDDGTMVMDTAAFMVITYIRQGVAAMEALDRATAKGDAVQESDRLRAADVKAMFRSYERTKGTR